MTLIMGYTYGDHPVLLGDVLLSRDGESEQIFDLPTYTDINNQMVGKVEAHVTGMRQKVNILSDKLIVAWAGNQAQARLALRDLKELVDSGSISADTVRQCIASIPPEDSWDLSLIGLYRDKTVTSYFLKSVTKFDFQPLSNVFMAGSGTNTMANLLDRAAVPSLGDLEEDARAPFAVAGLTALWLAAQATGIEALSGTNLLERWGGAIEIASFDRGAAFKIPNILYSFWECKEEDGKKINTLRMLPYFIKNEYQGQHLVTRTLQGTGNANALNFSNRVCVIPPLLYSNVYDGKISVDIPSLDYDFLCTSILYTKNGAVHDILGLATGCGAYPHPVRFDLQGDQIAVGMEPGWYETVAKSAFRQIHPDLEVQESSMRRVTLEELKRIEEG